MVAAARRLWATAPPRRAPRHGAERWPFAARARRVLRAERAPRERWAPPRAFVASATEAKARPSAAPGRPSLLSVRRRRRCGLLLHERLRNERLHEARIQVAATFDGGRCDRRLLRHQQLVPRTLERTESLHDEAHERSLLLVGELIRFGVSLRSAIGGLLEQPCNLDELAAVRRLLSGSARALEFENAQHGPVRVACLDAHGSAARCLRVAPARARVA